MHRSKVSRPRPLFRSSTNQHSLSWCRVARCKWLRGDRYLMSCVSAKHSVATWLRLCMPCITRGSWQAMGEWQIGSLRKCEQREGRPSSIIESDTPRGILIKKLRDNHSDSGVGADGGDSWASGCTGLYQHLCSPHTRTELCPHCATTPHTPHFRRAVEPHVAASASTGAGGAVEGGREE